MPSPRCARCWPTSRKTTASACCSPSRSSTPGTTTRPNRNWFRCWRTMRVPPRRAWRWPVCSCCRAGSIPRRHCSRRRTRIGRGRPAGRDRAAPGRQRAAIDLLRSSVAARPREASRALDLAEVYLQAGDAQQASDTLRTIVVSNDAEKARLAQLNFLSSVLSAGNDLGRAIERVVQKAPNDVACGCSLRACTPTRSVRTTTRAAICSRRARSTEELARAAGTRTTGIVGGQSRRGARRLSGGVQVDKDDVNAIRDWPGWPACAAIVATSMPGAPSSTASAGRACASRPCASR